MTTQPLDPTANLAPVPAQAPAIAAHDLGFAYDSGGRVFAGLEFTIPVGARVLLVGANGVGKSTLLRLLAGQHLTRAEQLRVLGHSPFDEPGVPVVIVDQDFPLTLDLSVEEVLRPRGQPLVLSAIDRELLELLEVRLDWRMNRVSEGMKRRVQLLLALRSEPSLLLLDEITAHLDLVVRSDLIAWLAARSRHPSSPLTTVYATHIFDHLSEPEPWPTHLLYLGRTSGAGQTEWSFEAFERSRHLPVGQWCEQRVRATLGRPRSALGRT